MLVYLRDIYVALAMCAFNFKHGVIVFLKLSDANLIVVFWGERLKLRLHGWLADLPKGWLDEICANKLLSLMVGILNGLRRVDMAFNKRRGFGRVILVLMIDFFAALTPARLQVILFPLLIFISALIGIVFFDIK
jgi:hypothetical protein